MNRFEFVSQELDIAVGVLIIARVLKVDNVFISRPNQLAFLVNGPFLQRIPQPEEELAPSVAIVIRFLELLFGFLLIRGDIDVNGITVSAPGMVELNVGISIPVIL